jgi:DNA-directed RNA polymerase subunit RPC12/RpoP
MTYYPEPKLDKVLINKVDKVLINKVHNPLTELNPKYDELLNLSTKVKSTVIMRYETMQLGLECSKCRTEVSINWHELKNWWDKLPHLNRCLKCTNCGTNVIFPRKVND